MANTIATGRNQREKALLVQVNIGRHDRDRARDSLAELERLADTAGADVVGVMTQRRSAVNPALYIGEGKLEEIQLPCRSAGADLIIFDNELSAVQVNNLDLKIGIKVIDRTELILQIFVRRAQSAEAQTQVSLAQLEYLVSRIPVSERQQRFEGGIGMKGPGESPLQLRNAPMRRRIRELKNRLAAMQRQRLQTRQRRHLQRVCLVGYTNAGKSTLLNSFAPAKAYVDDRLFATLDTKSRRIWLPDQRYALLTDTVGFIRHLPHGLVASFRATLDEIREADLLLHVADAAHPYVAEHIAIVNQTLQEINAADVPQILALNKIDEPDAIKTLPEQRKQYPKALFVSAKNPDCVIRIKQRIVAELPPT